MGSDNGLDRIDWDKPFHTVASPQPIHWHELLNSPKKKPNDDEVTIPECFSSKSLRDIARDG